MNTLTDTIKEFTDYAAKQKALSDRLKSAIEETAAGELGVIDYVLLSGDISEELRRSICVVSDRISQKKAPSNTIVVIIKQENQTMAGKKKGASEGKKKPPYTTPPGVKVPKVSAPAM